MIFANLFNATGLAAEGQKVALVIGNSTYKSVPLKNPVNDARDMAQALEKMGFEVLHEENASQRTMKDAIQRFGQKLKRGGVGLFYFAGHGMQIDGRNFLIPVNADIRAESDIEFESVDAGRILAKMEDAGNNMNLVILDSCRDNPFARSFRSTSRGLARMDAPHGSFIAYATAPGHTAADGTGRNGIFTESLLKHMVTPNLKIEDVLKRVRVEVAGKTSQKQIPWQSSSLMGDFYFVKRPATAPVASVTPNLPQASSPSLDKFLKESEARRLETEKWEQWQKNREIDYEKILRIDKDPYLAKDRKKEAWKIFLASVSQDNPHSYKDNEMRDYSESRFKYWENYREEPHKGVRNKANILPGVYEIKHVFGLAGSKFRTKKLSAGNLVIKVTEGRVKVIIGPSGELPTTPCPSRRGWTKGSTKTFTTGTYLYTIGSESHGVEFRAGTNEAMMELSYSPE